MIKRVRMSLLGVALSSLLLSGGCRTLRGLIDWLGVVAAANVTRSADLGGPP